MTRLDRYLFRQLIRPFLFFMLVFVGLLWLNQILSRVDLVVENGQPASVFLDLSLYSLPRVLHVALVFSCFAAAIAATNRLYSESELVIMMSSGRSNFQLLRPYMIFGVLIALAVSAVLHFAEPRARQNLAQKQFEISREQSTQLISPGTFTRSGKYTFFFGQVGADGELADIMINLEAEDGIDQTYFAQKGQAFTGTVDPRLLLLNGSLQQLDPNTSKLDVVQFDSFAFDLSPFEDRLALRDPSAKEKTTASLLEDLESPSLSRQERAETLAVIHSRFSKTTIAVFVPALALAFLLFGGYRRTGFLSRIIVAGVVMFGLESLRGILDSRAISDGISPYYQYVTTIMAAALSIILLKRDRPFEIPLLDSLFTLRRSS